MEWTSSQEELSHTQSENKDFVISGFFSGSRCARFLKVRTLKFAMKMENTMTDEDAKANEMQLALHAAVWIRFCF